MKITKIDFDEGNEILVVWTDVIENTGFNFDIDDIIDVADLKKQVKTRVQDHLKTLTVKKNRKTIADTFKSLEGQNI